MTKILPALLLPFMPIAASAHDLLIPHKHPHPVSVQADLSIMLICAVALVGGIFISRLLRRR